MGDGRLDEKNRSKTKPATQEAGWRFLQSAMAAT